jgi:hypothetical protein
VCRIYIKESYWDNNGLVEGQNPLVTLDVESYVNNVKRQSASFDADFTQTVTWKKISSSLPDEVSIELAKSSGPLRKRAIADVPPPGMIDTNRRRWESWDLTITAGKTKFSSGSRDKNLYPHCEVGDWERRVEWPGLTSRPTRPVRLTSSYICSL